MVPTVQMPTVRDMWRLALPLGTTLLGGELGLEKPVRWARLGGVLSPLFPELHSDEAALLDWESVQANNSSLTAARMVRELSHLRVAAVVVKGALERSALREAERSNTPLFLLPDNADLPRTARAVIRLITDREAQEESQAGLLYRALSQQVMVEDGLSHVVQTLHRLTQHAVSVTGSDGAVLAYAGTTPPDARTHSHPIIVADSIMATLCCARLSQCFALGIPLVLLAKASELVYCQLPLIMTTP